MNAKITALLTVLLLASVVSAFPDGGFWPSGGEVLSGTIKIQDYVPTLTNKVEL